MDNRPVCPSQQGIAFPSSLPPHLPMGASVASNNTSCGTDTQWMQSGRAGVNQGV